LWNGFTQATEAGTQLALRCNEVCALGASGKMFCFGAKLGVRERILEVLA
jgi:hypothetical protein